MPEDRTLTDSSAFCNARGTGAHIAFADQCEQGVDDLGAAAFAALAAPVSRIIGGG